MGLAALLRQKEIHEARITELEEEIRREGELIRGNAIIAMQNITLKEILDLTDFSPDKYDGDFNSGDTIRLTINKVERLMLVSTPTKLYIESPHGDAESYGKRVKQIYNGLAKRVLDYQSRHPKVEGEDLPF